MKVISKEEEDAHYSEVIRGGLWGGSIGTAVGLATLLGASRRYAFMRSLTLPFKAFLVSSVGTASAYITADRFSMRFAKERDPMNEYKNATERAAEEAWRQESAGQKMLTWARHNRYPIVFGAWLASMAAALAVVRSNRYLSNSQKLVQARVYAQGLTVAVLVATAALETADARTGQGRWKSVMVADPNDPTHQHMIEKKVRQEDYAGQDLWKDMVAAEERRIKEKKKAQAEASAQTSNESP